MKDEILDKIKKSALEKRRDTDEFNRKVSRILELQENPLVKEYSTLLNSIVGNPRFIVLEDSDIYDLAYRQHSKEILPEDTNGIYVFMGTFMYNSNTGGYEVRVSDDDPKANYRKYWDIELGSVTSVDVFYSEAFEATHTIIKGKEKDEIQLFRRIQNEFIKESIEQNQDTAIKLILKKYNDK